MPNRNIKYITCRAMAHILEEMIGGNASMVVLDIALHLNPMKLHDRLQLEIGAIEEKGADIVLGYGLCGKALVGVYSRQSRLILPRVDDCVGAILGSRQRHQSFLLQQSGCYFLEPSWLSTELDIFSECMKGLDHIPKSRKSQIIKIALKNYSKLAFLNHAQADPQAASHCRLLAETHGLEFLSVAADLGLIKRLVRGDWDSDDFVLTEPGREIPFF